MAKTKGQGNPNWTRDEVILALELYLECADQIPSPSDPRVVNLSKWLQRNPEHAEAVTNEKFRNPAGVAFNLQNIRSVATGVGLKNTSKTDQAVWEEFGEKPEKVRELASQIRAAIEATSKLKPRDQEDELTSPEGRVVTRAHVSYERSKSLRHEALKARRESGEPSCDCCGYRPPNLPDADWPLSALEVHHVVPIAKTGKRTTKLSDIALLCANCHRLIHRVIAREGFWPTALELRAKLGIKS
ncbi:HNH endonuclease [Maricaulis maris]|uniref:HNH endonuclease n=1 Tax=Maricaulis maris TaxID=74318 RepID=UPI003B8AA3F7